MKRKNTEEFKQEVYNLVGDEYEVLGEYKNGKTKIFMKHNTCDYKYLVSPNDFLQGKRCPNCFSTPKKTTEQFKQEIFDLVGDEYEVLGEYKTNKTKILIKHITCGNIFLVRPNDFQQGHRCSRCFGNSKKSTEEFKQEIFDLVGDEYEVLGEYKTNKTKILIKHNICRNEYLVRPTEFLRGNRCPYCKRSKGEEEISSLLDKWNYKYNMWVSFPDCKYKYKLSFDFQIFLKDGSFILLEYNGEQHYKNTFKKLEEDFEIQQIRDNIKEDYCKEKGIPLYIIRYDENIEERLEKILNR